MDLLDNLSVWRLLNACASTKSLSGAAASEDIDLATASRLMGQLEKRFGFALLDRRYRPARPTSQLFALASAAQKVTRAQKEAVHLAEMLAPRVEDVREIRISLPVNWMRQSTIKALFQYEKESPNIRFEIVADAGLDGLLSGRVQIGCMGYQPQDKNIFSMKLADEVTMLFASRDYIRQNGEPRTIEELAGHTLLMRNPSNLSFGRRLLKGDETFTIPNDWHVHYGDAATCRQALVDGEGIAVDLCFSFIADELAAGTVRPILPGWHREPWPRSVACPTSLARDPVIRNVMLVIQRVTQESFMDRWPFWYKRFGVDEALVGLDPDDVPALPEAWA